MSEKFKPYAASLVFLIKDNSVLLIKRANTGWLDGYYTLPSGHVDAGESATAAAVRETFEEVGVILKESDLSCIHIDHRKSSEDDRVYMDVYFVATEWSGEPINAEPEKCSDIAWFKVDKLPENTVKIVLNALKNYQSGIHYSELGW